MGSLELIIYGCISCTGQPQFGCCTVVLLLDNIAMLMSAVLLQGFRSAEEVQRFSDMMEEMCYIVATKHSGSLKVRLCTSQVPSCTKTLCCVFPL